MYEQDLPVGSQDYILQTNYVKVPISRGSQKSETKHKKGKKGKKKEKTKEKKKKTGSNKKDNKKSGKAKEKEQISAKTSDEKNKAEAEGTGLNATTNSDCDVTADATALKHISMQLRIITKTIMTVLNIGANPNLGKVPMPPLLLAMFSSSPEVVEKLLASGADPNVTTTDEKLSPLHILCSRKLTKQSVEIAHLLLSHYADANQRSSVAHWEEQRRQLLVGTPNGDQELTGKTPLHTLCMREDVASEPKRHQLELAEQLARASDTRALYAGHTALSLAVLRANAPLVRLLLQKGLADPHQPLGNNMGTALTVHFLNRYHNFQPFETCTSMLELLLSCNVNPFNISEGIGNALEFIEWENPKPEKERKSKKEKGKGSKGKKERSSSKTRQSTASGKSKKGKNAKPTRQVLIDYMYDACRRYLLRNVKGQAICALYTLIEEAVLDKHLMVSLARQVTSEEALPILKQLFNFGIIEAERFHSDICMYVIKFINQHGLKTENKEKKGKKEKHKAKKSSSSLQHSGSGKSSKKSKRSSKKDVQAKVSSQGPADHMLGISKVIDTTDFNPLPKEDDQFNLPPPEIDLESKTYKVCFHCLKGPEDTLVLCPECCLIYFCSEVCNRDNHKQKKGHNCEPFYKSVKKAMDSMEAGHHGHVGHVNRLQMALQKANEQLEERKQTAKKETEILKLEELLRRTVNVKKIQLLKQQLEFLRLDDYDNYNKISETINLQFPGHTAGKNRNHLEVKCQSVPFHRILKPGLHSEIKGLAVRDPIDESLIEYKASILLERVSEIKKYEKDNKNEKETRNIQDHVESKAATGLGYTQEEEVSSTEPKKMYKTTSQSKNQSNIATESSEKLENAIQEAEKEMLCGTGVSKLYRADQIATSDIPAVFNSAKLHRQTTDIPGTVEAAKHHKRTSDGPATFQATEHHKHKEDSQAISKAVKHQKEMNASTPTSKAVKHQKQTSDAPVALKITKHNRQKYDSLAAFKAAKQRKAKLDVLPHKIKPESTNKIHNQPNYALSAGRDGTGDNADLQVTVGESRLVMDRPADRKNIETRNAQDPLPRSSQIRDAKLYNMFSQICQEEPRESFSDIVTKKKISRRAYHFAELLQKYFPDMDFSTATMPFACYTNGQVLYNFMDDSPQATYSQL